MARSCGVEGVGVDRAGDISEAIRKGISANKPYLIDVDIAADINPVGAGVCEGFRAGPEQGGDRRPLSAMIYLKETACYLQARRSSSWVNPRHRLSSRGSSRSARAPTSSCRREILDRLDKAADKLDAIAIRLMSPAMTAAWQLVPRLRTVDHVVVPRRSFRAGRSDGDDGGRARHDGEQVLGRLACRPVGGDPARRIAHPGLRLPERSSAAEFGNCERRQRCAGSLAQALAWQACASACQCGFWDHRYRSVPPCRKRPDATCWRRRRLRCPWAASVWVGDIARQILSLMANGFATGSMFVYIDGGALVT